MMWYAEDGIIDQGFASTDAPSIESLMKTATKVDGMLILRWGWGYSTWDGQPAGNEGGLTLQCKEPKGDETITGEDISGTISYGSKANQGKVISLTSITDDEGKASWELEVEWDPAGEDLGSPVELSWGEIKDKNKFPFLLAIIPDDRVAVWAIGKRYPSDLAYTESHKVTKLTSEEEEMLGIDISGSDFKKYADDTFGVKHRYADHIEFDGMSDEDDDGDGETDEDKEEDDEDSENDGDGSEPDENDVQNKKRKERDTSVEQDGAPSKRVRK